MNKVFHLLRDNKQSGPFTIDELLQQKLTTNDLLWVEGYSHVWTPPSELDLLKLSFAENNPITGSSSLPPTTDTVFRDTTNASNPLKSRKKRKWADEDIETRAEEIRRRTLEYVSSKNYNSTSPLITDDEIRSSAKTPDIDFVVHKKSRGVSANFIGAALVAIMLAAGWYGKDKLFIAQNNTGVISAQDPAPQVIPIATQVEMQPSYNESAAFLTNNETDSLISEEPLLENQQNLNQAAIVSSAKPALQPVERLTIEASDKIDQETKTEKQVDKDPAEAQIKPEKNETATVSTKPDSAKNESSKTNVASKVSDVTEDEIEKKKTLGQAIKGIFKKKKKDKEADDETENDN